MLDGNFVLLMVFLFLNVVMCIKKIPEDFPIINILIGLFTVLIDVVYFLPDSNIPATPYLQAILGLISVVMVILSVMQTKV